ncbi:MAG: acyltransferase [bacterium]
MKEGHIPELDGIRAMSILLVLATHLLPVGPARFHLNSMTGLMGMSLFFCLSGFLITRFLFERPDVRTFLTRRIARIYPLLAVYAILVPGLALSRWDASVGIVFGYINYDDPLLFKGTSHFWSICVELHFYLGIGLAVLLMGRRGFWLVPLCALLVLLLRIDDGAYQSIRTHLRIDEILSGSLLALIWLHRQHPLAEAFRRILATGFLPLLLLWLLSCHEIGGPVQYARPYLAMGVVGSIIFMPEGFIRQICRNGVLKYLAGISYALYVWHPMTAMGWLGTGGGWERYLIKRPISFALTFLLAHISTNTLETYFIRLARRGKPA